MNASQTQMIEKCRSSLKKESVIKSVLFGLIIGLSAAFLIAFVAWFFEGFKGLWISLGVGLGVFAASAVLLYFFKFIPTDIDVMKRLDRSGLDERMITMYELKGDDSYMASRQRADAEKAFDAALKVGGGAIVKVKIATAVIVSAALVGSFGVGMTVVTGLSDYGVIPTVDKMFDEGGVFGGSAGRVYTVEFSVDTTANGKGTINGTDKVTVKVAAGGSYSVTARPEADDDGKMYYLDKWVDSDGNEYYPDSSVFVVKNVNKSITYTAVFAAARIWDSSNFGYYFDPDNQGNAQSQPGNNSDNPPSSDNRPSPPQSGPGGGTPADVNNNIIDGETPYDEKYDYYYQMAMDMLANGTEGYPPELVEMIEAYFGILLK